MIDTKIISFLDKTSYSSANNFQNIWKICFKQWIIEMFDLGSEDAALCVGDHTVRARERVVHVVARAAHWRSSRFADGYVTRKATFITA